MKIASVDSFQGGERDYIVLSCVRSGIHIGFLRDRRRLNVAITRARFGLVIIRNAEALSHDSTDWKDVCEHFRQERVLRNTLPEFTIGVRTSKRLVIERVTKKDEPVFEDEIRNNAPEVESGFQVLTVKWRVLGREMRMIWPDNPTDLEFLRRWTGSVVQELKSGFATIALCSECVGFEPLCLQLSRIFTSTYDVEAKVSQTDFRAERELQHRCTNLEKEVSRISHEKSRLARRSVDLEMQLESERLKNEQLEVNLASIQQQMAHCQGKYVKSKSRLKKLKAANDELAASSQQLLLDQEEMETTYHSQIQQLKAGLEVSASSVQLEPLETGSSGVNLFRHGDLRTNWKLKRKFSSPLFSCSPTNVMQLCLRWNSTK
jgi:hypothetical protein